jgi:undecaprenyl phosphate N,N'-diacetylbacillosamine 1-phosphate transferase
MYSRYLKRLIDFGLYLIALIVISPLFLGTILLLTMANREGVFFIQTRPSKDGKRFEIVKFKTMNDRKKSSGNLLRDDMRLSTVGKWIRKLSLDEIPKLLNVI